MEQSEKIKNEMINHNKHINIAKLRLSILKKKRIQLIKILFEIDALI